MQSTQRRNDTLDSIAHILEMQNSTGFENGTDSLVDSQPQAPFFSSPSLVCGVVMIVIAFTGIIGNIITAAVFSYKKPSKSDPSSSASIAGCGGGSYMSAGSASSLQTPASSCRLSSFAILVTGLACIDAILLSLSCPLFASSAFYAYNPTLPLLNAVSYMTVYVYPLASIFQTASVWTLSVITLERYIAVCRPFRARIVCTPSRAVWALVLIMVISAGYNGPRFWEYCVYRIQADDDPDVVLIIALPTLRGDSNYMRIYGHWMYFVFIFALPFSVLVFLNGSVVRAVRLARSHRQALSRQQTKEQSTAVMMVSVAIVFLACNLLAFVLNALEVFGGSGAHRVALPGESSDGERSGAAVRHSSFFYLLVDFNNLLVMTHCSVNFFVYYNFSERFRVGFHRLRRRWAHFCLYCNRLREPNMSSSSIDATLNGGDSATSGPVQSIPPALTFLRRYSAHASRSRRNSSCGSGNSGKNVVVASADGWTIGNAPIRHSSRLSRITRASTDSSSPRTPL